MSAMRNVWTMALILVVFEGALLGQPKKPLPTEFVDCVSNQQSIPIGSHTLRSPVLESQSGDRAFGEVIAELSAGTCINKTAIYVSQSHRPFRLVFEQKSEKLPDSSVLDGNGIRYLSWSPTGKRLLAVIFQWTWGTDGDGNEKYVLIERAGQEIKIISPEETIRRQFQQPCSASISFARWLDDDRIEMEVRPVSALDEGDPARPCLKSMRSFSFEVESGKARRQSVASSNSHKPK